MHIMNKIHKEIDELQNEYEIDLQSNEFDALCQPIPNNCNMPEYGKYLDWSMGIINRILTVHGKAEIVDSLRELAHIEPRIQTLPALKQNVRDHILHAVYTFLVGAYIIEKIDMPQGNENDKDMRDRYRFMWKLCGPLHDIGYTLEISWHISKSFMDKLNNILDGIHVDSPEVRMSSSPEQLAMLCNGQDANKLIQDRLKEWSLGININDYYDWLKHENKTDHGVIGALAELKIIDKIYQKHNPTREEKNHFDGNVNYNERIFKTDIVTAASTIFIHNIDPEYDGFSKKIDFQIAPMAFMLFLCDTFQEWNRPTTEEDKFHTPDQFNIDCLSDEVRLTVPSEIENDMYEDIRRRLTGLTVTVNGKEASSRQHQNQ